MTVTNITNGELFTVRIYKRASGLTWANNYEVQATQDVPFAQTSLIDLANRLVNLERALHLQAVTIDRVVISTYVRDSRPYNPETFVTIPVGLFGQRSSEGDPLPIEYCLFVRRSVQSGRTGKLLYRGCLLESAATTIGFRPVLGTSAQNEIQSAVNEWFANQWLVSANPFNLVMASGDESLNVRVVQGLAVSQSIVIKQWGNAYFDRANPA